VVAAINAIAPAITGMTLDEIEADLAGFWRRVVGDSQLRWLGPEKGVIHLAGAAIVNAVWDVLARRAGKPLWRYLADMTPADRGRHRLPPHPRCARPRPGQGAARGAGAG
jgi:L-fuconate dehydratase